MTYRGYLNYYLGTKLKTYHFDGVSEKVYYILCRIFRMKATVFVGALVISVKNNGDKTETLTLVDENTLEPRADSNPTLIAKK